MSTVALLVRRSANFAAANNAAEATPQDYKDCMASFNSSPIGKATSFFSLLDFVDNFKEWLVFGSLKAIGVGAIKAETSATVTDYSITAGTATTTTTGLETVVDVGSKGLGAAGSAVVAVATAVDAQQRSLCMGGAVFPAFP